MSHTLKTKIKTNRMFQRGRKATNKRKIIFTTRTFFVSTKNKRKYNKYKIEQIFRA